MPKKAIKNVGETKSTVTKTVKAASKTVKTKKETTSKKATKVEVKKAAIKKEPTKAKSKSKDVTPTKKKTTAKKAAAKSTTKKATAKKSAVTEKKASAKKPSASSTKSVKKTTSTKAVKETKKSVTKQTKIEPKTSKAVTKKSPTSKVSTKIVATSKSNAKKATEKKTTKATKKETSTKKVTKKETPLEKYANVLEYYDLPYRYNETVVKILAQTPKILFVYWDISDADREKYSEKYGEYFFNDTYPVLIVHNKTLNYTEEVEINDFANSWYISIPDSRSEYTVELGRRFKEYAKRNPEQPHKEDLNNVIQVASSNEIVMPNDHVLLDELKPEIKFRNVKTGEESVKTIKHILADKKLVDFYNLYQKIYQVEDIRNFFNLDNPSSKGNPSSTFK